MKNRDSIQDELKALHSGLPSEPGENAFTVPAGYFEGLADSVLARVKAQEASAAAEISQLSPLLSGISRQMPFSVPESYFQSTSESVAAIMSTGEEETSMTSFMNRNMPYEVPAGYFDKFSKGLVARVTKQKAKVIPFGRKQWARMAVAAAVAGIIALSGIFYFSANRNMAVDNPRWVASKLKNVSDKGIEDFVKLTDAGSSQAVTAKNRPKSDVKGLLNDVSDKELEAFLEQVPAEEELAVN